MGIQIETTIYGPKIGNLLAGEPEELAYMLNEIADYDAARLGAQVWGHAAYDETDKIVAWLRAFADAIEAEGEA